MNYSIRAASNRDLDGLCSIRNHEGLFRKYLDQDHQREGCFIVAEMDGRIAGFVVLKLSGNRIPKLSDLYVKEACRGKGVGSALIRYQENMARTLGYSELFVSVDPQKNPRMIQLITRLGYAAVTEPYLKTAIFYNEDGTAYETTYTRVDLKKRLNDYFIGGIE
ncbi:GNAT family N-acetyltransferase [Paenibacillus tritici]|uniref:GNAT family N-acetyltransferase n=1 Tax=Paenibacillus tritici TaxID=1873425 RepID=UPI001BACC0AC|nr:GNAT family N-acetyltransferase [Paenibacillus tritici]QUL54335.1 GNAT family N-acetyltransferase [Paenibacillus tritici]